MVYPAWGVSVARVVIRFFSLYIIIDFDVGGQNFLLTAGLRIHCQCGRTYSELSMHIYLLSSVALPMSPTGRLAAVVWWVAAFTTFLPQRATGELVLLTTLTRHGSRVSMQARQQRSNSTSYLTCCPSVNMQCMGSLAHRKVPTVYCCLPR